MQEHHLEVLKTARYFTIGEAHKNVTKVLIACHGYAELAGIFIKQFEPLATDDILIVAPEALSKFYTKGFFGTVGATWMTREDRENEINNYVRYLQKLYELIRSQGNDDAAFHILGFSQGCATVCRWLTIAQPKFEALWLCAGNIPDDLDFKIFKNITQQHRVFALIGNDDPFIGEKDKEKYLQRVKEHELKIATHFFDGGHVVNLDLLKQLGKF